MISPDPKLDWAKILAFAVLSIIGGSLGYTIRALDKSEKVSGWRAILEGLSAGFFAVIIGFICMEQKISFGYTFAIIGLLSWAGARTTFILVRSIALRKLGVPEEKVNERSDSGN